MFRSYTYGELQLEEIPEKILDYVEKMKKYEVCPIITFGTDSQNFHYTKMVSVIVVTIPGHGGIFFYEVTNKERVVDVRNKLRMETNYSLELADRFISILENDEKFSELYLTASFSIHIDAGNSDRGKTRDLIPELVGWVKSMGFDCETKPASYAASSVANKLSK